MTDTDLLRMNLIALGIPETALEAVIANGGQTWDTDQLRADYEVLGFMAPFVVVKRRSDGVKGTLMFVHQPRLYYCFDADV